MPAPRKQINVSTPVKQCWDDYKKALQNNEGRYATDDQILAAFLQGIPLWQANLMIGAYLRSGEHQDEDQMSSDE